MRHIAYYLSLKDNDWVYLGLGSQAAAVGIMFSMETTILVVIIILVTRGEAKDDLENIVNQMN